MFAEALQISTGGKLTGADARAVLLKQMELGNVKTADLLPIVARLMNDLSAGGIEAARRSSGAEQMRAENALLGRGGLLQTFSQSGGEEGFARMWNGINSQLTHAKPLAEGFGRAFEFSARQMQKILTFTESFNRAIDGKSSMVAEWLGDEATAQLRSDWAEIKNLLQDISNAGGPVWIEPLKTATLAIKEALGAVAAFSKLRRDTVVTVDSVKQEKGILAANWFTMQQVGLGAGRAVGKAWEQMKPITDYSLFGGLMSKGFDWMKTYDPAANYWNERALTNKTGDMSMVDARDNMRQGSGLLNPNQNDALMSLLEKGQGLNSTPTQVENKFELQITIENGTEGTKEWFETSFSNLVERTLADYPSR